MTEAELAELSGLSDTTLLKLCWEQYGDEYAAVQMEQMYEKGAVTDSEFTQDIADAAAHLSDTRRETYQNAAASVNGATLDDEHLRKAVNSRRAYFKSGKIPVSLFATREKRERIIHGINLIRIWLQNPRKDNQIAFENFMHSDELTSGEFIFLYEYMEYYGEYLPMYIKANEVKAKHRSYFVRDYLKGHTRNSNHILAKTYMKYTDYERLWSMFN